MADVGSPNFSNLVYGQHVYLDSGDASVAYRDVFALCTAHLCITSRGRVFNKYGGCWIAELVELGICALAKIERG